MAAFKRGTHLVNWPVQGALIGRTLFHWTFFLLALCAMVFFLHLMGNMVTGEGKPATGILQEIWGRHRIVVISLMCLVPFFCLDLILWSHRFAGPMIRIRRSMHDLSLGKSVAPIRLRSRDYWKSLADDFNLLLQRIERAEKQADEVQAKLAAQRDDVQTATLDEALQAVDGALSTATLETSEAQHSTC